MRYGEMECPDVSLDEALILFDERVHLIEGMRGFTRIWASPEQMETAPTKPEEPEDG